MSSKIDEIGPWIGELAALGRLVKKNPTLNGENDVITFSSLFFI